MEINDQVERLGNEWFSKKSIDLKVSRVEIISIGSLYYVFIEDQNESVNDAFRRENPQAPAGFNNVLITVPGRFTIKYAV